MHTARFSCGYDGVFCLFCFHVQGKKKIEKQMRLDEEDKKMHEMSVVDTPMQSTKAMVAEQVRRVSPCRHTAPSR